MRRRKTLHLLPVKRIGAEDMPCGSLASLAQGVETIPRPHSKSGLRAGSIPLKTSVHLKQFLKFQSNKKTPILAFG